MTLLERFREWRAGRQEARCARGWHHWKSLSPDRVRCVGRGACGKWYGR